MKTTPVLILASVAAAVVIVAVVVSRKDRVESPDAATPAAAKFFDGLAPKLSTVSAIVLKHGDKEFTIHKTDSGWDIPERANYPAKTDDVKKALFQIGELRKWEERTQKPDLYSQLNVQDPDGKPLREGENGPTLMTLKDDKGQTLASAIIGNTKFGGGSKSGVFVRKAGEAQSWLAEGSLDVPGQSLQWLDTNIVSIQRDRIKGVTVTQPDGSTVRISRSKPEDQNFTVADVPAGKELKSPAAGDQLATALSGLIFDDITTPDQIDFDAKNGGKAGAYCEFRTFDGLMIAVQLADKDAKTWARLSAYNEAAPKADDKDKPADAKPPEAKPGQKSPDEVKKEVDELNAKLSRWAFAIPAWKVTPFNTKMADLLKADEPPKPPPSMEGTMPAIPAPAPK